MSERITPTLEELLRQAPDAVDRFSKTVNEMRTMVLNFQQSSRSEQEEKNKALRKLKKAADLLKALGYTTDHNISIWSHKGLHPCPGCGGVAEIQKYHYDDGGWVVICTECSHRTEAAKTPVEAMKAWVNGEYTYESVLTQNSISGAPRTKKRRAPRDESEGS